MAGIEKPIGWDEVKIRNQRAKAEEIVMDLSLPNEAIHQKLHERFPKVIDLWWELEEDERSGWVYNHLKVLAKLVHCGPRGR